MKKKRHKKRCVSSHLALSVDTHVQRVITARCAIHHRRGAFSVEVVTFSQAVERTGLHPTWAHTHTDTHIEKKLTSVDQHFVVLNDSKRC